ncbi:MAG: AzlC family ABC transporter permease [bacterium]
MTAPFTTAGLLRGIRDGIPLGVAIFIYGVAIGLVADQARLSLGEAVATSGLVYSGSAQLAALSLIATGHVTLVSLAATILLMNARYIMFGAALHPWLAGTTTPRALGSLLLLGDANWIVVMRAIARGETDRAYLPGTGLPMLAGWLSGTAVGALSGQILPDPKLLAADMMLPAFAAAMMAGMLRTRSSWLIAAVGAAMALMVQHLAGSGWAVIAAGLSGGIVAFASHQPPTESPS